MRIFGVETIDAETINSLLLPKMKHFLKKL